jgi:hypothetical protein
VTSATGWLITAALAGVAIYFCPEGNRDMTDLRRRKVNSDLHWLHTQCEARLVLAFPGQEDDVPLSVIYDDKEDITPWIVRIGEFDGECFDYPGNCPHAALAYFVAQGIPKIREKLAEKTTQENES